MLVLLVLIEIIYGVFLVMVLIMGIVWLSFFCSDILGVFGFVDLLFILIKVVFFLIMWSVWLRVWDIFVCLLLLENELGVIFKMFIIWGCDRFMKYLLNCMNYLYYFCFKIIVFFR